MDDEPICPHCGEAADPWGVLARLDPGQGVIRHFCDGCCEEYIITVAETYAFGTEKPEDYNDDRDL